MAAPTIPNGEEHFFPIIYEGNGAGQRVGKFVPFTDSGTIANSVIFNSPDDPKLGKTFSGAGTEETWTFSCWIKLGIDTSNGRRMIFSAGSAGSNFGGAEMSSTGDNSLEFYNYVSGSYAWRLQTNRTLEDRSKWYHLLFVSDTTNSTEADRARIYIDGERVTSFATASYPSLNYANNFWMGTTEHEIGTSIFTTQNFDGYMAEVNNIDGSVVLPSTFGLTDTSTGRWIPKTLSGISYGTNGFRLTFADSSAFGDDTSGNTNDFTVANLVAGDQTTDSPTQNSNTFGSTSSGVTLSEGNLTVNTGTSGSYIQAVGQPAFGVRSGKWYWEVKITTLGAAVYGWKDDGATGGSQANDGGSSQSAGLSTGSAGSFSAGSWFIDLDYDNEVNYTTVSTNDVLMFAMDLDSGKGYCGKNGTWFNSANPANGTGAIGGCHRANGSNKFYPCVNRLDSASVGEFNFGQRSFAYTPPTGFVSLQQDNMPETAKGISGFTWIKDRDNTLNHNSYDSSNGVFNRLVPNATSDILNTQGGVSKFLKGGIVVGDTSNVNNSGASMVSWNWVANGGTTASNGDGSITSTVQANSTAGFSIVKWTGTGSNATVGHGLSTAPSFILGKVLTTTDNWIVGHHKLSSTPWNNAIFLNTYGTLNTSAAYWNNTAPTSSVFTTGTWWYSSQDYVAYCWHEVDGFSKFGKYTGNGVVDGPFIYTGFKPRWLLHKANNGAGWYLYDSVREKNNPLLFPLFPNTSAAESTNVYGFDFLSNGFKLRQPTGYGANYSGVDVYYMAFAEHPFVGDGTSPVTAR
jgi:hypothetical protein